MNKLVKGNLVRGLPSKISENDHTCVACKKGKQHKATCKAKLVSSISQPLQMLHMDLFGPTSVMSINHKMYCLVVTDDFSKFSWVLFLASKDETSKAKAVNTACYVLNRALVSKTHNKTPYELLNGYDSQFHEKEVLDIRKEEVTETVFDNRLSDEENSLANDSVLETKTSASKTSKESMEKHNSVRPSAPIIEDWESDSDDDCEIRPSIEQNK
nr:retrovirus-related Pol polyprotein from transposon TNT 1-94 [Tanacetum cinerariifolium]